MTNQTSKGKQPARVLLEEVPRVHFYDGGTHAPESEPFSSCLRACLEFMGDDRGYTKISVGGSPWELSKTYVYIMGTSGAAFRLTWNSKRWDLANTSINVMASDPLEPIHRAFEAVGRAYEAVGNRRNKFMGHEETDFFSVHEEYDYFRPRIVESIGDRRRPVLAFGVIGPPECCVITGYDEHGEVIMGWNFFQDFPELNAGVQFEPSGMFRKRDWFPDTLGLIIIGEEQEKPPQREIYREALKWALEIAHTPKVHDYHSGLAAYTAWAQALLQDDAFPPDDMAVLREHHMVHNGGLGALAEARWYASLFLNELAEHEPIMADHLSAAADCYQAQHDLMWEIWNLMGGNDFSDDRVRQLAEPAVRQQIAPLILRARDKEAEAADYLERALAK